MAIDQSSGAAAPEFIQLTTVRVPLEQAADAFLSQDSSGRSPIVVFTERQNRIENLPLLIGVLILVGGIFWSVLTGNPLQAIVAVPLFLICVALALFRSFLVRIPEGTYALLQKRSKYLRTVESGRYILPPWIVVSHLVTRRIIPFEVPINEAPTQDNVRSTVQALVTFSINAPYNFVYRISASDFDQVFQAACQNTLRAMVRQISSEEVNSLTREDTSPLQESLSRHSESYGVKVEQVNIVYAHPPVDFVHSQEARQLALLQQKEQAEQQALALRKQTDGETLARQAVMARIDRERQEQIQQAEIHKLVVELEANAEDLRLTRLQERLERYQKGSEWDWALKQLEVARGLAGNTHAVVQLGSGGATDIARAFLLRNIAQVEQDNQVNTDSAAPA